MKDPTISMARDYFKSFIPSIEIFFPNKKIEISIQEKGGDENGAILKIAPPEFFEIIESQYNKRIKSKQYFSACEFSFKSPEIITNIHNGIGTACIFFLLNKVQASLNKEFTKEITTVVEIKKEAGKILEEQYKNTAKIISCLYRKEKDTFHLKISIPVKRKGRRKIQKRFAISGRNKEEVISLLEYRIVEKRMYKQNLQ